jgi:biotin-(acetyl-CoA carboxylase) ligase
MAKQSIGRGTTANDGTGDDLRAGANKINQNFDELYTALGNGSTLSVATVATTGAYNDLSGRPTLGTAAAAATTDFATAAQGTDSREWTATTVSQAEAEAGTATTRRAWTAQRVAQAIAAQAPGANFSTVSALSGNWRGQGSETLITATTALQAASSSGVADGDKGDITVSGSGGTWTIDSAAVTFAKMQDGTAMSVLGRSANSTGVMALMSAGTDGHVLRRSGTTLGFGTLASGAFASNTIPLTAVANITAQAVLVNATGSAAAPTALALSASQLLGRGSTGNVAAITLGTNLSMSGATLNATGGLSAIAAQSVLANATGSSATPSELTVAPSRVLGRGPTGNLVGLSAGDGITITDTTISVGATVSGTKATPIDADTFPLFDSADSNIPKLTTLAQLRSSVIATNSVPTAAVQDAAITDAKISNRTALSVFGRSANSVGVGADIAAGTDGHVLRRSGTTLGFGTLAAGAFAANTAPLSTIANQAANTFLANATAASAAVTAVALAASQLAGRGSTGNIAAITMGTNMRMNGTALASDTRTIGTALGTTGTVNLDLAAITGTLQTIAASGNLTFTASNYAAGRFLTLRIAAGGSTRTLAWPSGWVRFGAALPTSLASGASIVVTIVSRGTVEADVDVAHQVSV